MVQWLGLLATTAGGPGSIPGLGTRIPQAAQPEKKKIKENRAKWIWRKEEKVKHDSIPDLSERQ